MKSRFAFAITVGCSIALPAAAIAEDIQLQVSAIPISMAPPDGVGGGPGGGGGGGGGKPPKDGDGGYAEPDLEFPAGYIHPTSYYNWMHEDVGLAHFLGYTGTGSHLIIVDDHASTSGILGSLTGGQPADDDGHGHWTSLQASLVAPDAGLANVLWDDTRSINTFYSTTTTDLNVVNLSFGLLDLAGLNPNTPLGNPMWDSLVAEAHDWTAVFVKAAGNEGGVAVDGSFSGIFYGIPGQAQDYLNLQLIGAEGALFVGALDGNGTVENPASIASYSTIAGRNSDVQNQFLVVGVDSDAMGGLAGTSFAAPIVTGYAAILGNKFTDATPDEVVDQLLATARTDTIRRYKKSTHGMGEADLSRALAPDSIN